VTTFVVPLDGSEVAELALRPACAYAARVEGGRVLLVTCDAGRAGATEDYLSDRASLFEAVVDIGVVSVGAEPVGGIRSAMVGVDDPILCMASHGRSGLGVTILGSVAEELVRLSGIPVLLIGRERLGAPLPR